MLGTSRLAQFSKFREQSETSVNSDTDFFVKLSACFRFRSTARTAKKICPLFPTGWAALYPGIVPLESNVCLLHRIYPDSLTVIHLGGFFAFNEIWGFDIQYIVQLGIDDINKNGTILPDHELAMLPVSDCFGEAPGAYAGI